MTSRERLLTATNKGKPDRMPAQVYAWSPYFLNTFLGGGDQFDAYRESGLDWVVSVAPTYIYNVRDLANWQVDERILSVDGPTTTWQEVITTPLGVLNRSGIRDEVTVWESEPLIKCESDFELFRRFYPIPSIVDHTPVREAQERVGDNGIVRTGLWGYGQPGPWQSLCCIAGLQQTIEFALDNPGWTLYALQCIVDMQLRVIEKMRGMPADLVEVGGGAGSSTVISPKLHRGFCLRYDKQIHDALHSIGLPTVYHLCGGLMGQLESVFENGTEGLGSMAPVGIGGDCDLEVAYKRVDGRMFVVGGFDQIEGFELGGPEDVRRMVHACHTACPNGGYICSTTDSVLRAKPENLRAYADAARECVY